MDDEEKVFRYQRARFTEPVFRPYALAIGEANLAWNDLHECLGRLFGLVVGTGSRVQPLAIWQSSIVDRAKRKMLEAAMVEPPPLMLKRHPLVAQEISWVLSKAEALEDTRNDVIHAPLHLEVSAEAFKAQGTERLTQKRLHSRSVVAAHTWGGNARAKKVSGKNILVEYRWLRDATITLRDYVNAIDDAMDDGQPWPDRPPWPVRAGSRTRP